MYLFGGSFNFDSNESVYALDLRKFVWEKLRVRGLDGNAENIPAAQDEQCSVLVGETVILFGGFVNGERTNNIYKFHLKKNLWEKVELQDPHADQPCPRAGHSAVIYNDVQQGD